MTTLEILKTTYKILPPKHQKQIFWLVLGMILVIFFELGLAGMISLLGVAMASPDSLNTFPIIKNILLIIPFPEGISPVVGMLTLTLFLAALATICKNIMTAFMTYQQHKVSQSYAWDVVTHIFKKYLYAPYLWHSLQNTAELQTHLTWRIQLGYFILALLTAVSQGAILFCLLLTAFIISPLISLLLFGVCGALGFLTYRLTQKKIRMLGEDLAQMQVQAEKTSHFALQGIREVHIYNQRHTFLKQFDDKVSDFPNSYALQNTYPHFPLWILEAAGFVLLFFTVIILQWQGKSIALITGTLTLMAGMSWRMLPAMNKLFQAILTVKMHFPYVAQLIGNYFCIEQETLHSKTHVLEQALELKNISFTYPHAEKKALNNININISKGNMVGLVGLSGAGKSTLIGVLTGLLPPTAGDLLVDGVKVKSAPGYLNIGYVPQSPYIMDATLAQNVAFSDWGKEIDEERVENCCKLAAMNFLKDLPKGIHTMLGDRGVRLSGGQVQRVAIARALYTQPDILLFDEATSALDGATEAEIQQTILSLRKDLTIVIVAHRLSTVEGCDNVYWLREGVVLCNSSQQYTLNDYKDYLTQINSEN